MCIYLPKNLEISDSNHSVVFKESLKSCRSNLGWHWLLRVLYTCQLSTCLIVSEVFDNSSLEILVLACFIYSEQCVFPTRLFAVKIYNLCMTLFQNLIKEIHVAFLWAVQNRFLEAENWINKTRQKWRYNVQPHIMKCGRTILYMLLSHFSSPLLPGFVYHNKMKYWPHV